MVIIPVEMFVNLPGCVQNSICADKMISVVIVANCVEYIIVTITVNGMHQSNVTNGSLHRMSAIPTNKGNCVGKTSILIRHNMQM